MSKQKNKFDKKLGDIVTEFPHNDNEFIFVIRGNISNGDMFFACKGKEGDFGYAVLNLCLGNEQMKHEIDHMNRIRKEMPS